MTLIDRPDPLLAFVPHPLVDLEAPRRAPLEQLADALRAHVAAEAASLAGYRALADTAPDPVVALVMEMVIEDDTRHHEVMRRIVVSLENALSWSHTPGALPDNPPHAGDGTAVVASRLFAQQESEGARHLRELARTARGLHGGLVEMLMEWMAADSQKHQRALQFIQHRLRAGTESP